MSAACRVCDVYDACVLPSKRILHKVMACWIKAGWGMWQERNKLCQLVFKERSKQKQQQQPRQQQQQEQAAQAPAPAPSPATLPPPAGAALQASSSSAYIPALAAASSGTRVAARNSSE